MDFSNIPLFGVMKARLDYMSQRQGVLAQNVANADTPGYRVRDVAAPDFAAMAKKASSQGVAMTRTNPGHVLPANAGARFAVEKSELTDELNPNDNNVSVEEEMMKIGQNQAEYQKVLNLYGKTISMFKTALGRNG